MKRLRAIWRRVGLVTVAAFIWLALHGTALAQAAKKEEPNSGGEASKYLPCYAIVILGVALGLLFVCNSSRRRDRAKPEEYGE